MDKTYYEKKMERVRDRGDLNKINKCKQDVEKIDRERDRGDLRQMNRNKASREEMELKEVMPDCETSGRITNPKSNKATDVTTWPKLTKTSLANKKQAQGDIKKPDIGKTVNPKPDKFVANTNIKYFKTKMENNDPKVLEPQTNPKTRKRYVKAKPNIEIKANAQDVKNNNDVTKKDVEKEKVTFRNKTHLNLEGRKHLMERYTVKLKNCQYLSNKSGTFVHEECNRSCKTLDNTNDNKISEDTAKVKPIDISASTHHAKLKEERISKPGHRKPIIKTEIKDDNRVFKAVTFVDQKQNTPLQIDITNEFKKQKVTAMKVKLKPSRESIKEAPATVKKRAKKRGFISPDFFAKDNASPPTEVAKWVPSFLNAHTAPYYTAWVNTTLTATSKQTDKDLEQQILQLQQMVREHSPDLVHQNYCDERYAGKIKVRQRFDPRAVKMAENCIVESQKSRNIDYFI